MRLPRRGVNHDMLPNIIANPAAIKSPLATQGPTDSKAPETGEFDFLNYLLGLKDTEVETMVAGEKVKTEVPVGADSKGKTGKNDVATNLGLPTPPTMPAPWNSFVPSKNGLVEAKTIDKQVGVEVGKEVSKDAIKEVGQNVAKVSKDLVKDVGKDLVKDAGKDLVKDVGKDLVKDATKDAGKAVTKEASKGVPKAPLREPATVLEPTKHPISDGKITVRDLSPQVKHEPVAAEAASRDKALQKYSQVAKTTHESEKVLAIKTTTKAVTELTIPTAVPQVATANSSEVTVQSKNEKRGGKKEDTKVTSLDGLIQTDQPRVDSGISGSSDVHHVEMAAGEKSTVPELFSRVNTLIQQGGGKMTVSLNPPHLGQVEVQVTARGKKIEVEMKSESSHAKSLLETHAADLKQSLQTHDLVLSKMEVQVNRDFTPSSAKFAGMFNQENSQQSSGGFNGEGQTRFNQPHHETPLVSRGRADFALAGGRGGASGNGRVDLRI